MTQRHDPNVTADSPSVAGQPISSILAAAPTTKPPSSTRSAVPPVGTERYTLGDEIARGGMGIVFRATDTVLGREVAVKVLHEKYTSESGAASRFIGEASIAGQLQHPSIPPVHDLVGACLMAGLSWP